MGTTYRIALTAMYEEGYQHNLLA